MADRSRHLVPYWHDQSLIRRALQKQYSRNSVKRIRVPNATSEAGARWFGRTLQNANRGDAVLLLSDFGWLASNRVAMKFWEDAGTWCRSAGLVPIALIPFPAGECPQPLRNIWRLVPWETGGEAFSEQQHQAAFDALATFVSPLSRLEPGLLREIRRVLPESTRNAGVEGRFWASRALLHRSSDGGAVNPDLVGEYAAKLAEVSAERLSQISDLTRSWRARFASVWCSEALQLRMTHAGCLADGEAEEIANFLSALADWCEGSPRRISDSAVVGEWVRSLTDKTLDQLEECSEPRDSQLADSESQIVRDKIDSAMKRLWKHAGDHRRLWPGASVTDVPPIEDSPVAFRISQFDATVYFGSSRIRNELLSPLASIRSKNRVFELQNVSGASKTDAFWASGNAPEWASGWGRDEFGAWVDFRIAATTQSDAAEAVTVRMRWVPAGTFLMGSPEDEEGRLDREGPQHEVTISNGFWMFDAPVTQELWKAVMGENPSDFKGTDRPVENVSWDDCQTFIERMNERFAGLNLGLPTEAEWEHACRGGTSTPRYVEDAECESLGWVWENSEENGEHQTHPGEAEDPESARTVRHTWQRLGVVPGQLARKVRRRRGDGSAV